MTNENACNTTTTNANACSTTATNHNACNALVVSLFLLTQAIVRQRAKPSKPEGHGREVEVVVVVMVLAGVPAARFVFLDLLDDPLCAFQWASPPFVQCRPPEIKDNRSLTKHAYTMSHTHTRAHSHAHTHTHTRTRTRTRTHTHTHNRNTVLNNIH